MDTAIAHALIEALGGAANISDIEPCMVRIRVEVYNPLKVNEQALRIGPVIALVRVDEVVQIVAGEASEALAAEMVRACEVHEVSSRAVTAPRHAS